MSIDAQRYASRGVSANKTDVHDAIQNLDKGLFPKAFCKILPDYIADSKSYCNIMHADTAGTKTSLAYMYWRETGDLSVWKGIVQDAMVMNLDDMACVGCVDKFIVSSTIGRNKNYISGDVIKTIIHAAVEFCDTMRQYNIDIKLAGGETADVGDIVRTIDVGFTAFARLQRKKLIVNNIKPGNVIVGFSSTGKSIYETETNSGMGCNGLTSARHDILDKSYAAKFPESYDTKIPEEVVYAGTKHLTDNFTINNETKTLGKWILSPTRTFLPLIRKILLEVDKKNIAGIIHNTGGGQTKVLKYVDNVKIVKNNLFPTPPIFNLIQAQSQTDWREMYQVFNMGTRLEIYCNEKIAENLVDIARLLNIEAKLIGHVENTHTQRSILVIENLNDSFNY